MEEVNSPNHYLTGGIETIEVIRAKLSADEYNGYLKGNIFKYVARAGHKGKEVIDLRKAKWYLEELIKEKGQSRDGT